MKKRNILMCLEHLDIGGVETAVVTLCKGYKRAGHNVYVAAPNGIYSKQLKEIGVDILDLEYEIDNYFHLEKKDELIKFCKNKKITELHIHQYPCIMYWLPVCIELNIPYIAYAHSIVPGSIEWFTKTFSTYKISIPMYYENASKILCIAESTKKEIETIYHFGEDKYIIIPNSLNMEDFTTGEIPKKIKTFGIAARFSKEKIPSIMHAIDLFANYLVNVKDSKLLIAGDGKEKKLIEDYINTKKIKNNVTFLGSLSNMPEFYKDIDAFIGVDRCVLEAMACNRLVVISSYTEAITMINKSNIGVASRKNFSGMNLEDDEKVLDKLLNMTTKEYKKIVEENYEFINEKYNVDNNLYTKEIRCNYTLDYKYIFEEINDRLYEIKKLNNNKILRIYRALNGFVKRIVRKIKSIFIK